MPQTQPKLSSKRNFYISYLKGLAILAIILIHLVDWSELKIVGIWIPLKELLYPGVLFFVALSGTLTYVAYVNKPHTRETYLKLCKRGLRLLGVYFGYSLLKLYLFNFKTEPYFYWKYVAEGKLTLGNILTFQAYSVPLSIIITIGILVAISPVFVAIVHRFKRADLVILGMILALGIINYVIPWPPGALADLLWSRNTILIPPLTWVIPYLIGFLIAMWGFEKYRWRMLGMFSVLAAISYVPIWQAGKPWFFSWHMYPLELFYLFGSFALMYALIIMLSWIKRMPTKFVSPILNWLAMWGDNSLWIYIGQWIVIDLTYLFAYPNEMLIWYTVPGFLVVVSVYQYLASRLQKSAAPQ